MKKNLLLFWRFYLPYMFRDVVVKLFRLLGTRIYKRHVLKGFASIKVIFPCEWLHFALLSVTNCGFDTAALTYLRTCICIVFSVLLSFLSDVCLYPYIQSERCSIILDDYGGHRNSLYFHSSLLSSISTIIYI